jgi:3',5'-cyclic AMP phosphodiesterase CpdA
MRTRTLAHLSDLHFGLSAAIERKAAALCRTLLAAKIDHVVVTGDITHRGRQDELARFRQVFGPLLDTGRMTLVPGNHDRLGEDVAADIADGMRISRTTTDGLCIVRVDSTGPHNRSWRSSHGVIEREDIAQVEGMLHDVPRECMTVVALHHHVLPLPEDTLPERLASRLGSLNTSELQLGPELVRRLCGRCDLLLHGHRHVPYQTSLCLPEQPRPLHILNAGSSSELGAMRVFSHTRGRLTRDPRWIGVDREPAQRPSASLGATGLWGAVRAIGLF